MPSNLIQGQRNKDSSCIHVLRMDTCQHEKLLVENTGFLLLKEEKQHGGSHHVYTKVTDKGWCNRKQPEIKLKEDVTLVQGKNWAKKPSVETFGL